LGAWTDAGTTSTLSSTTNPSGSNQSYVIAASTSNTNALRYNLTFSASTDYSYSVFLKAGTSEEVRMQIYDGNTFQRLAVNPLNDFEVVDQSGINSYSIQNYGSGWYRVVMNFTTTASAGSGYLQIYPDRTGNLNNVEAWGAQLEAGSYVTSYIPTYGTSVTRAYETLYNISNLYQNDSQTIFLDLNYDDYDTSNFWTSLQVGTGLNDWFFFGKYQNSIRTYIKSNNVVVYDNTAFVGFSEPQRIKILLKYDSNGAKTFLNGSLIIDQSYLGGFPIPAFDRLTIQSYFNEKTLIKTQVNQILVFPTALTNAECEQLTTI